MQEPHTQTQSNSNGSLSPNRDLQTVKWELEYKLSLEQKRRQKLEQSMEHLTRQLWAERIQRQHLERALAVQEGRQAALLSLTKVVDYGRFLWWLLIQPDEFKRYKASLSERDSRRLNWQSSILSSILIWCPIFLFLAFSWAFGIIDFTSNVGFPLLGGILVASIATGLLGLFDNAFAALLAILLTSTVILPVVAIVAGVTDFEPSNKELMIWGGVLSLVSSMIAQVVSSLTELSVSNMVASAAAVLMAGGTIVMLPESTINAFHPILVALVAILLSGLAQERYKGTLSW